MATNWSLLSGGKPSDTTVMVATNRQLLRLNLGCGHDVRPGYTNVDSHPGSPDVVFAQLPSLPFEDNSAQEVVLSHVLEHFGYDDGKTLVAEIYRVLAPGGVAQIEVPDIAWCMAQFLGAPEPSGFTETKGDYGYAHRWGLYAQSIWGDQHHDGLFHKWGYTINRLIALLQHVGFQQIAMNYVASHGVQCLDARATK